MPALEARAAQWQSRGAPVEVLDRAATERHVGTDQYAGAWLDRRAGVVQPLAYARELARTVIAAGVAVHGRTLAKKLERSGDKWIVTTANGATVTADRVVLATNGYTGELWPKLKQTIIAANSFQIATKPLSDNVRKSILPGGQANSDSRRIGLYYRLDHTGHFLLGGRGRHDAVVMFRMLKIVLGHDAVAAGIGVTGQLQILLVHMARRTADLDLRSRGIEGAIGIEAAPTVIVAAAATTAIATMLRPAAASARALH